MKFHVLLLAILIQFTCFATDSFSYKLKDKQKLEGTYSAAINDSETIHFLLIKDRNEDVYKLVPIHASKDGTTKELQTVSFKEQPMIVSHHSNGSVFSILSMDEKNNLLSTIDIDVKTGNHKIGVTEDFKKPENVLRLKDKTIFVNNERNKEISVSEIVSASKKNNFNVAVSNEQKRNLRQFYKSTPDAVNTQEYVKNGSISDSKLYYENGNLIYTNDESLKQQTNVLKLNPKIGTITFSEIKSDNLEDVKDYNSYFYENNIYSVLSSKEDLRLNVFNAENSELKKSFSLQEELLKQLRDYDAEAYLKSAKKGKMVPTITLNKTKEGNIAVRIDQVDETEYNYNYNYWMMLHMHMHMQMMMQQNTMNNIPTGFGPNPHFYDEFYDVYNKKNDVKPIEFVLNKNFEIIPNGSLETVYDNIDREKVLEPYEDNKELENFSAEFITDELRYIYQDRKSKEIFIKSKKLD